MREPAYLVPDSIISNPIYRHSRTLVSLPIVTARASGCEMVKLRCIT